MAAFGRAVPIPIVLSRSLPGDRARDLYLFLALVAWLVYTRFFFVLRAGHMVLPPCPFYYLTGHPCPFCGGTRSFAYLWQGDLSDSVRLYPLGPAFFVGALLGAGGLASGLATGRSWSVRLTRMQWRVLGIGVVSAIAISWALKLFVLGN
jgi:uncharacterized protein DUF2752